MSLQRLWEYSGEGEVLPSPGYCKLYDHLDITTWTQLMGSFGGCETCARKVSQPHSILRSATLGLVRCGLGPRTDPICRYASACTVRHLCLIRGAIKESHSSLLSASAAISSSIWNNGPHKCSIPVTSNHKRTSGRDWKRCS